MTMTGEIMKDDYEPEEGEIQDDDDISTEDMRLRAGERAFSQNKGEKNSTHLLLFHRDDPRAYLRKQDNNIHNGRQYYHQDLLDDNYTTHGTSRSKFHSSFHRRFSHKCSKEWNKLKFSNSTNRPRQLRELRRTSSSYYSSYSPTSERRSSSNVSLSGNTFSSSVPTWHWYRKRSKAKNEPHKTNSIERSPNPKDIAKNSPPASSGDSNANFNLNKLRDANNEIIEDGQNMREKESQNQTFPDSPGTVDGIEIIVLPPKVPEIITLSDSDEEHSKIEENAPKSGDEMQVSSFFNNEKNQVHISNDCAVGKTEQLECTADKNYDNLQDRELKSKLKNVFQENLDESQKSIDISSSNSMIDFENQAQNILFDSSIYSSNTRTPSKVQEKNLLGDIQSYNSSSTAIENIYTDMHNFFNEKELQSQVTSQSYNPKNGIQKTPFKSFTFSQNSCSPRASCIPANLYEESSVPEFVTPESKCVTDINSSCKKSEYNNSPIDSLNKWVKDCFPSMNIQDERNCDYHKSSDITPRNELPHLNSINSNNVIQECNVYAENETNDMIVEIKENSYEDEKIVKMNSQSNVVTECIHRLQSQSPNTVKEKNTQESLEQTNDRANSLDQRKGVYSVSNNIFVDNIQNTSQNIQIAPCLKSTTLQINQSPDKIVGNDSLVQTEMYLDTMSCKKITQNEEKTLYQKNIKFPRDTEVGSVSALKRRANELRKLKKNNLHAKALKLTEITKNEKIHSLNVNREKIKDSSKTLYSQPSHSVERTNFLKKCGNNTNILEKHNISSKSGNKHLECSDIVSGKCFAYSKNILIYEDRLGSRNNDVGSFREKFSQRINVTVPEFIINLGKESDSEDDSEEESIGNHSKDDKKEIINNQNNSNTSQPVGTEFEKKLDILLKQARSQQELNADNKEVNEQLVSSFVHSHTKENGTTLPTPLKVNQGCARVTPKTTTKKLTCSNAGKAKLMNQKMKSVVVRNTTSNLHRDKNISYDMNRNNSLSSTFITGKHTYKGWSKCAPSRGKINSQTPTMANIKLLSPVKQKEYLKLKKQIVQMTQNKKRDKNRSSGRLEQNTFPEKIEMGSSKDMKEHLPSSSKIEVHSQNIYAIDCCSKLDSNFENGKENQSSFSIPQIVGTHENIIPNASSAKPKDYVQKTVLESSMELHSQNEVNFTTQELLSDKNRNNFENIKFQTHKERGTEDKRRDEGIECITSGTATKETMCNSLIHSQVVEDLWSAETKLISKRRQVLEDIATVRLSLHQIDAVNFKKSQILKNIHQLKEELKRAEEHLNIETEYLKTLNVRVDDSKHNIHKGQCELLSLSLECEDLGCKVHGLNYNVPNTCVDLIRTEMLAMNKAMQELENQKSDA